MKSLIRMIALAAAAAAAGCLQKDTAHTLYLEPDGRMTWLVVERDVRSDESDPGRRAAEEQRYLLEAEAGSHGVACGLLALSPLRLRTQIVRRERPFFVATEAEFVSIDAVAQRVAALLGLDAGVHVAVDGGVTTLTVRIDATAAVENDLPVDDGGVSALLEDLERYRVVLTEGRFVGATGFRLAERDTVAVPVETPWDAIVANGGVLELSLSWTR